ncbi:MAG: OmpH family outer membrane protein [Bacteroidetes bacterium]|nr:OmpH family outer membrane protein [Bacteroidota bacterium]MBU1800182.1 OmpH family outer membrane protein [Bacteroidota bacterium]
MKKLALIFFAILLFISIPNFAQLQIGYVNSDAILQNLPDAQDAQKKIDALIQEWKEEIQKMERELDTKTKDFNNRKLVMSDNKKLIIEKELEKLESDISKYREGKFGYKGELYSQQEEIMKPIQNKVFNAIQDVAEEDELDFVFDKSGDIMFLYAKDKFDITAKVVKKLE